MKKSTKETFFIVMPIVFVVVAIMAISVGMFAPRKLGGIVSSDGIKSVEVFRCDDGKMIADLSGEELSEFNEKLNKATYQQRYNEVKMASDYYAVIKYNDGRSVRFDNYSVVVHDKQGNVVKFENILLVFDLSEL